MFKNVKVTVSFSKINKIVKIVIKSLLILKKIYFWHSYQSLITNLILVTNNSKTTFFGCSNSNKNRI